MQMPSEKREYKVAAVLAALSADIMAASTLMTFTMRTREEALVVEDTNGSFELPLPSPPISKEDTKTICLNKQNNQSAKLKFKLRHLLPKRVWCKPGWVKNS